MVYVENGISSMKVEEAVLFPFDDYSIPFNKGLLLTLIPGRKTRGEHGTGYDPEHPDKPVVEQGKPGDPDCREVCYNDSSVIHVDGEYRMWYAGQGEERQRRLCYAVSKDGVHWEKPKLGLVEYNGSTQNNLVDLRPLMGVVLYEPEDPDPDRRFKIIFGNVNAAYSRDGLRWKESPNNPVVRGIGLEPCGLIKFNGCYYLNGQGGRIPHPIKGAGKRTIVTLVSYDFEHWTQAVALSFRRDNIPPRPPSDFELHRGEQVHEGAGLWNRGNVVIGFYGQYHNESNDRRFSTCDIGLIVSNDAIHFREPVPDFKMIPSYEEPDGADPRLLQGQGCENIGDRTIYWYSVWRDKPESPTGVRIATWPRDRLGYFSAASKVEEPHFISCPLRLDQKDAHIYINADGLSENSYVKVEVLDLQFRPLLGYSGDDSIAITESGFRQPAIWRHKKTLEKFNHPIRVRVNCGGIRQEDAHVYTVYVG